MYDRVLADTEIPLLPETYSDSDGDGLTNLQEYTAGTNPHEADTDGDTQNDGVDANPTDFYNGDTPSITLISGNNQSGLPDAFTAASLLVEVRNSGGTLLQNAPVDFTITGSGGVSATSGGSATSTVILRTAVNGRVGAYAKLPPEFYETRTVRAKTVSQTPQPYVDFTVQTYAIPQTSLRLWLKSDAGVTKDGSDLVATWADQSGNALNATQATGASKPLWVNSVINGLPVIRFDGTSDILNLGNVLGSATAAEIFVILKANEDPPAVARTPWSFKSTNQMNYPATDGRIRDNFGCSTEYYIGDVQQSLTSFHLYSVSAGSNSWSARLNGELEFFSNPNTVSFSTSGSIGAASTRYFGGDFAEFIIYTRQLTEAERLGVQKYLQARYALAGSAPSAPSSLAAHAVSSTEVSLIWSGGGQSVLERKVDVTGSYEVVGRVENGSAYLDRTVVPGTNYVYRVRNQNLAGYSSYASTASVSVPSAGTAFPFADLKFWSRADTGTVPKSGDRITSWLDSSSQAKPALQSTTVNAPLLVQNVVNGRPVMRFDGSDDSFTLANVMNGATEGELFAVLKSSAPSGQARGLVYFGTGSGGGNSAYPNASGNIWDGFGSSAFKDVGKPHESLAQFHIYNSSSKSNDWRSRLDGLLRCRLLTNTVGFTASPSIGYSTTYFQGDFAEILVFSRVLSNEERETVENYLGIKYGLATAPAAPSEVAGFPLCQNQYLVMWKQELTHQRTNYTIERKPAGGSTFTTVATVRQASTWIDPGVAPGQQYVYRIKASRLGAESGYSSEFNASIPSVLSAAGIPLGNLRLWLRGDMLAAGDMSCWAGPAEYPNTGLQITAGSRPLAVANGIAGRSVARFSTNDVVELPNVMQGATAAEMLAVVKPTAASGTQNGLFNFGTASFSGNVTYPDSVGRILDSFGSTASRVTGVPGQPISDFNLYGAASTSAGWSNRINGRAHYATATNTVGFTSTPSVGYSGNYFNGDMAELLVFDRELTPSERRTAERYLAAKYLVPGMDPDQDGLTTGEEITLGSAPLSADTNGDGLEDGLAHSLGLSLVSTDTDGDGLSNAAEAALGTSPIVADTDRDGTNDNLDDFPLDPTRDEEEPADPGDTTPPVIILLRPMQAVPVP